MFLITQGLGSPLLVTQGYGEPVPAVASQPSQRFLIKRRRRSEPSKPIEPPRPVVDCTVEVECQRLVIRQHTCTVSIDAEFQATFQHFIFDWQAWYADIAASEEENIINYGSPVPILGADEHETTIRDGNQTIELTRKRNDN